MKGAGKFLPQEATRFLGEKHKLLVFTAQSIFSNVIESLRALPGKKGLFYKYNCIQSVQRDQGPESTGLQEFYKAELVKKETQLSERREDNKVGLVDLGITLGLSMLFSLDYVAHLNSSYCCLQKSAYRKGLSTF